MLLPKDAMFMRELDPERLKNFTFGRQPAAHAFFDAIDRQGRYARKPGEFRLAQHLGFAKFPHVVLLHSGYPLQSYVFWPVIVEQLRLPCQLN
jgi:hypothetical protein